MAATTNTPNKATACTDAILRVLERVDTIGYISDSSNQRNMFKQIHTDVDLLFDMGCIPHKEADTINYALPLRYDSENTGAIITYRSNTAFDADMKQLQLRKIHLENTLYKYIPKKYVWISNFAKFIVT